MLIPRHLCGIIGWPLGHTLSPLLHNWGFGQLDWPGAYLAFPTPPEGLEAFLDAVRALPVHGLSVTIPHKRAVMPRLDAVSPAAQAMGAVNTLYWQGDRLCGENTDVAGFLAPLAGRRFESALVLGVGGAARAVVYGLKTSGVADVAATGRDVAKVRDFCAELGCRPVAWDVRTAERPDLLVNATPLGMSGERQGQSPWPAQAFLSGQTAYDLVYNPLRTRFLDEAALAGCEIIDGLGMFLGQGVEQFRLWTGLQLPVAPARELLRQALSAAGR